jgi:hypothetical protein
MVDWQCQVVRERDFRLIADRAWDASAQGMLVPAEREAFIGEELIVSFQSPEHGIWFDLDARVARIIRGHRHTDKGAAFGIEFAGSRALDRLLLRSVLRKKPQPRPARAVAA